MHTLQLHEPYSFSVVLFVVIGIAGAPERLSCVALSIANCSAILTFSTVFGGLVKAGLSKGGEGEGGPSGEFEYREMGSSDSLSGNMSPLGVGEVESSLSFVVFVSVSGNSLLISLEAASSLPPSEGVGKGAHDDPRETLDASSFFSTSSEEDP